MAFMMKAGWELCTNHDALWVRIIKSKYKCREGAFPIVSKACKSFNFWHGICRVWGHVEENILWRLGTGLNVNFWNDPWVPSLGILLDHVQGGVPDHLLGIQAGDMVNSVGEWELDFVEEWLLAYVRDTIRSISPPSETGRPDILAWTPFRDGEFTVRSAYTAVAKLQYKPNPPIFRVLWEWEGHERIKLLLWRVAKSAMLTNEERFRRRLTIDPTCPRCSGGPETISHVLRDCPVATAVWMEIFHIPASNIFFHSNFSFWL